MGKRSRADVQETLNDFKIELSRQIRCNGWNNVTFATLQRVSGLSRSGIAHHFGSREGLYQCIKHDMANTLSYQVDNYGIDLVNPYLITFFLDGVVNYGCDYLHKHFNSIEIGLLVIRAASNKQEAGCQL